MVNRYFPGELIFVHPGRPVRPGDFVIIRQQSHAAAPIQTFLKRLVRLTDDEVVAEQFNPSREITFKRKYVIALHSVLTTNELHSV